MHYFIDGYNMLFHLLDGSGDLQSQREAIIYDINKKASLIQLDVTIVFDSTYQPGNITRTHFDAVEIVYTAEGETADEYILEELKNAPHPQRETVVTSDKPLKRQARHCSAHVESVDAFMQWLNRAYKNKIRQFQAGKKGPVKAPQPQPLPPPKPLSTIPPKDAPLEAYSEYYQQQFETEWQEILEKEELEKKVEETKNLLKRSPRKPRQKRDPFKQPPSEEPSEANEMERWLKLFEKRSRDNR